MNHMGAWTTCIVVQQNATDEVVVFAVELLLLVEGPEGCGHQGSFLVRVDCVHCSAAGQVQRHQLGDAEPGGPVQWRFLFVVVTGYVHLPPCREDTLFFLLKGTL